MTSTDDIQAREAIPADIMQVARKTVAHEKSLGISNIWTNTVGPLLARIAELEAGLRGLLDCPDIADNDYKDEETHAAERVARSLLNKDRQP